MAVIISSNFISKPSFNYPVMTEICSGAVLRERERLNPKDSPSQCTGRGRRLMISTT